MDSIIKSIYEGKTLTEGEGRTLFEAIFEGKVAPVALAGILTALKMRGEKPEEIAGAAAAMRGAALPVPRPEGLTIGEIVGTGGDGTQSINISTTAAIAAAATGLFIAKHGNSGVSSRSGASDVLTSLGFDIKATPEESAKLLKDTGFAFCYAKLYHPAMRFAGPVRAELKTRTIFNILGPLTNPAHPDYAVIGVYSPALLETVANVLKLQGMRRAFVVHGAGADEAAVHGETEYAELCADGTIRRGTFTPADFGVETPYSLDDIKGGSPEENAQSVLDILGGKGKPAHRAVVAANLALLLIAGGKAETLPEAMELAYAVLDSGKGLEVIAEHRAFARHKAAPATNNRFTAKETHHAA